MIIPLIDSVLVVAQSVIFNHAPIGLMFAVLVSLSIFGDLVCGCICGNHGICGDDFSDWFT